VGGLVSSVERELGVRVSQHTFYMMGLCPECLGASAGAPVPQGKRRAGDGGVSEIQRTRHSQVKR
jgi:hypothetical protein